MYKKEQFSLAWYKIKFDFKQFITEKLLITRRFLRKEKNILCDIGVKKYVVSDRIFY